MNDNYQEVLVKDLYLELIGNGCDLERQDGAAVYNKYLESPNSCLSRRLRLQISQYNKQDVINKYNIISKTFSAHIEVKRVFDEGRNHYLEAQTAMANHDHRDALSYAMMDLSKSLSYANIRLISALKAYHAKYHTSGAGRYMLNLYTESKRLRRLKCDVFSFLSQNEDMFNTAKPPSSSLPPSQP